MNIVHRDYIKRLFLLTLVYGWFKFLEMLTSFVRCSPYLPIGYVCCTVDLLGTAPGQTHGPTLLESVRSTEPAVGGRRLGPEGRDGGLAGSWRVRCMFWALGGSTGRVVVRLVLGHVSPWRRKVGRLARLDGVNLVCTPPQCR